MKESNKCGDCASNFTCLLELEYGRALKYAENPASLQLNDLDKLFFPQNWCVFKPKFPKSPFRNCEFSKYLNNYTLLRIELKDDGNMKLLNDLFFQFREKDVNNDDLSHIYKQINEPLLNVENRVVEEANLLTKIKSDENALKFLVAFYYHDFLLFKFDPIPINA